MSFYDLRVRLSYTTQDRQKNEILLLWIEAQRFRYITDILLAVIERHRNHSLVYLSIMYEPLEAVRMIVNLAIRLMVSVCLRNVRE